MLNMEGRVGFDAEHDQFRDTVRRFLEREVAPHYERWERQGIVDRSYWSACAEVGLLCPTVPEEYGGLGLDFRYNAIVDEESGYAGVMLPSMLQSDISVGYVEHYATD